MMKKCIQCKVEKTLNDFYKDKKMSSGYLNKCKICVRKQVKDREQRLRKSDSDFVEKQRIRGREKYYRLKYKNKYKNRDRKEVLKKWKEKYPEKIKAKSFLGKKFQKKGFERHHWSYNKEHYCDIIYLTTQEHSYIHRFLLYDKDSYKYKRIDNNELLDTKLKHLEFINYCLNNKSSVV